MYYTNNKDYEQLLSQRKEVASKNGIVLATVIVMIVCSMLLLSSCGSDGSGSRDPFLPRNWGAAEMIETDDAGGAFDPQIAIDAAGHALVVWSQFDGFRHNIWANRYTAGSGWGIAELIETDDTDNARNPQIAIEPTGNAFAIWKQSDGTRNDILAKRYIAGSGWGITWFIETSNGDASNPQIAIDVDGNALAVWSQDDGTRYNLWANRYTAGGLWGIAELIETDNAGDARGSQIAIDTAGNALTVWAQTDGTRTNIWSNRYTAGSGWGTAELIETDNAGDARGSQIAIDTAGNAVAVWAQSDGTRTNIWGNRYTAGSGWGTAELIETDNAGNANSPQVAIDADGNAIAVWEQSDGTSNNIMTSHYTASSGWGLAELIENNTGGTDNPKIVIDATGNALTVWEQDDDTGTRIWSNRYTAGSGWGLAEFLENNDAGGASYQQIAIDPAGNAIAVSSQDDGTQYSIYVNRFE